MSKAENRIRNLKKLGQAQSRLNNEINQIHESKQQMVEDSTLLFQPLTKQSEQSAQDVLKAVEGIGRAVASPEEAIIKSALEKVNDPVFGIEKRGDNYVFKLVSQVEQITPNVNFSYDALTVSPDGVTIAGTTIHHDVTKQLMHVLTRNAQPLNAYVKKAFMELVDLSIGVLLVELSSPTRNAHLDALLHKSVKFESIIAKRYKFEALQQADDSEEEAEQTNEDGYETPTDENETPAQLTGEGLAHMRPAQHDLARLSVLMGAADAGNVQSGLREFTSILDKFKRHGQVNKRAYKLALRRFLHTK